LLSRPERKRNVGRPRLKWLETTELKAKAQRQNANNGQKCASFMKQSKIYGCKGKITVTK
jgi:hypothetical protein